MSGGERVLVRSALHLWEANGVAGVWEIPRRLDRGNFERVLEALAISRGDLPAGQRLSLTRPDLTRLRARPRPAGRGRWHRLQDVVAPLGVDLGRYVVEFAVGDIYSDQPVKACEPVWFVRPDRSSLMKWAFCRYFAPDVWATGLGHQARGRV
jgi:hypothetical protein